MLRVLHVDDKPGFLKLTAEMLEVEDGRFDVITATSASEGMELLEREDVDCIVSDYQMPGMDGIGFLREVRDARPDIPFVLFTGRGSEEIASRAISTGATDYLQKGDSSERYELLANRIENAVQRHRAEREMELGHRALETASEGISLVDPDGTFSFVNPAFADLFGYEPGELTGEDWTVLYHEEEATRLQRDILPAVRETGYWAGETVRLTGDGERLVTDHRLAYADEDAIVCTARDITDERLDPNSGRTEFELLVDQVEHLAFYTLDHEGYVTRWNEGAANLFGYEGAEIIGRHVGTFFAKAEREDGRPEQLIETVAADGSRSDDGMRVTKSGDSIQVEETVAASYDESRTLKGFAAVIEAPQQEPIAQ